MWSLVESLHRESGLNPCIKKVSFFKRVTMINFCTYLFLILWFSFWYSYTPLILLFTSWYYNSHSLVCCKEDLTIIIEAPHQSRFWFVRSGGSRNNTYWIKRRSIYTITRLLKHRDTSFFCYSTINFCGTEIITDSSRMWISMRECKYM